MGGNAFIIIIVVSAIVFFGFLALIISWYKKTRQGQALVRTGFGKIRVSFSGMMVIPVIHKYEVMDITLKTIVTTRKGIDGLICKDNMRADIQVTFFVRVNKTTQSVEQVAQSIGCARASDQRMLESLFDAKFSEALKTVGKRFEFVELYNERNAFKEAIINIIGTDLNGYVLDDCAIDYLEQTPLSSLNEENILDAEGIKKIIEITSREKVRANLVLRDKEKTIKKQDVEAEEAILELQKQLVEKQEKQRKEVETIKYREQSEIDKIKEEERQKAERARIAAEEEIQTLEENKERQVIIAKKNKEKAEAIETERVERERQLEATEREKIVAIATIEKDKALEEEKRKIQEVIKERVAVEKSVVEEEERIKDTQADSQADREKRVALTKAEQEAQEALVRQIKAAEAGKQAAEHAAKQRLIEADAEQEASVRKAEAKKIMADAEAAEVAAKGMGEAQVIQAKAEAMERKGESDAKIIQLTANAEAQGIKDKGVAEADVVEAKATANEKQGLVEAKILSEKMKAEAQGIEEKAAAMKKLDGVGKEHEEFKLNLEKDTKVELAQISIQKEIAEAQAHVIAEALKAANIDIVGGETMFFDSIIGSITKGKSIDRLVDNSQTLEQIKDAFFDTKHGSSFKENLRQFVDKFGLKSEDIKNLSISNLLMKMANETSDSGTQTILDKLLNVANVMGVAGRSVGSIGLF